MFQSGQPSVEKDNRGRSFFKLNEDVANDDASKTVDVRINFLRVKWSISYKYVVI